MTNTDNVTNIETKQPQPSCRFSIQATLKGFPITVEGEGRAGDLKLIVERLLQAGAEPPTTLQKVEKSSGAPLCPAHNSAMKKGRRGYFCPRKDAEGEYCRETA